jgi:hypothetical protein
MKIVMLCHIIRSGLTILKLFNIVSRKVAGKIIVPRKSPCYGWHRKGIPPPIIVGSRVLLACARKGSKLVSAKYFLFNTRKESGDIFLWGEIKVPIQGGYIHCTKDEDIIMVDMPTNQITFSRSVGKVPCLNGPLVLKLYRKSTNYQKATRIAAVKMRNLPMKDLPRRFLWYEELHYFIFILNSDSTNSGHPLRIFKLRLCQNSSILPHHAAEEIRAIFTVHVMAKMFPFFMTGQRINVLVESSRKTYRGEIRRAFESKYTYR